MGILDKIGDVIGDIVDGVVDFVDDVFNVDLKKILSNDIVRYGLMAISLFTGGVAIVNGVMQGAGEAALSKSLVANLTDIGKGFIEGVKAGFADPLGTAGDLLGQAQNALSGGAQIAGGGGQEILGTGNISSDQLANAAAGTDATAGQLAADMAVDDVAATAAQGPSMVDAANISEGVPDIINESAASSPGAPSATVEPTSMAGPGNTVPIVDPTPTVTSSTTSTDPSIWARMGGRVSDFATSPAGMMTLSNAASGYAQGAMMQKQWDDKRKERRRIEDSWATADNDRPRFQGTLPTLSELRKQILARGQQSNAKYGY